MVDIAANLNRVRELVERHAGWVGRDPAEITLVAITKTVPPQRIQQAYDLGLRQFGENRVQEAANKIGTLPEDIRWHMVGHLQRNKVKLALGLFDIIHSLDSLRLATALERRAAAAGRMVPLLVEVNVGGEESKYGFRVETAEGRDRLLRTVEEVLETKHLRLQGLMTLAPIVADPEEARPYFRRLWRLREELKQRFPQGEWKHLSMGMTDDYATAIEEGATIIRLGRAIFGERK